MESTSRLEGLGSNPRIWQKILIVSLTLTSMNFGFRDVGSNPTFGNNCRNCVMAAHVDISVE